MMALTSVLTTVPSAAPMMTPIARARALVLSRNALKPAHRRPSAQCSTTLGEALRPPRSSPRPSASHGTRRTMFGRAASTSWKVVARLAALRCASSARRVDAGRLEQVRVLGADAGIRIRSTWLTHLRICVSLMPVAFAIAARPRGVAPRSSSVVGGRDAGRVRACRPATGADPLDLVDLHRRSLLVRARRPLGAADDTLGCQPEPTAWPPEDHGPGVPRRDGGRLRADRAGPRPRQPDARRRARRTTPRVQVALSHAQPPRAHRRRDGDRQDEDAPAHGRPAVEGGRAGLRRRHQGRPDRPRRARATPTNPKVIERIDLARLDVRAVGPPGRVPVALGQARGAGPGDRPLVRAAAARQGPRPQRDADLDPRARLQVLRRQRPAAARPQGPRDDAQVPRRRTRASRSSPTTAGCRARRSASSCARSSSSSRRAPTSSSASPSSTSRTCSGRRPRARASSASSSCPTSWTSRACSRRSCSGCSPSCTRRCPRRATCPKPKLCFFFDEAHLLFDDASEALMDQIERTARLIRSKGVGVYFVTQAPTDVPVVGPGPARQPRPARAARLHARRRRRAAQDRPDLPDDRVLRRREDDHLARHRRGARHRPLAARRPDAAGRDAPPARPTR